MPPKRVQCQICGEKESKYTCSKCMVLYCSVPCYKQHKDSQCSATADASGATHAHLLNVGSGSLPNSVQPGDRDPDVTAKQPESTSTSSSSTAEDQAPHPPSPPLRPLTSLKWPYIPEESAYPDPLKRDDPKQLQLRQYESIATSQSVRRALASHPQLPVVLRTIDSLRGEDREEALQRALGIAPADLSTTTPFAGGGNARSGAYAEEDVRAMRELAEAIEAAVRGGKEDALGLDWGD